MNGLLPALSWPDILVGPGLLQDADAPPAAQGDEKHHQQVADKHLELDVESHGRPVR